MKIPSHAPAFAIMYPALCEIAREEGYALSIHGSLHADLDLIAVPWIENPTVSDVLVYKLTKHLSACLGEEYDMNNPEKKPHGRVAYNLYMGFGVKVDLSILPTIYKDNTED
jgi:hypothetical protein